MGVTVSPEKERRHRKRIEGKCFASRISRGWLTGRGPSALNSVIRIYARTTVGERGEEGVMHARLSTVCNYEITLDPLYASIIIAFYAGARETTTNFSLAS